MWVFLLSKFFKRFFFLIQHFRMIKLSTVMFPSKVHIKYDTHCIMYTSSQVLSCYQYLLRGRTFRARGFFLHIDLIIRNTKDRLAIIPMNGQFIKFHRNVINNLQDLQEGLPSGGTGVIQGDRWFYNSNNEIRKIELKLIHRW